MSDQGTSPSTPPSPSVSRVPRKARLKGLLPSKQDLLIILLAINFIGLVGLGIRVYTGAEKPMVVTVGVRQLTGDYLATLASSNVAPPEAAARTQLFLSVAQDSLKRVAVDKNVLVLARECVLAGEHIDLTNDVGKMVRANLDQASGGLAAAAPALSTPAPMPATPKVGG